MRADRGELNVAEARGFFIRYGMKLGFTSAYSFEANGKSERGHLSIINALDKVCKGKPK